MSFNKILDRIQAKQGRISEICDSLEIIKDKQNKSQGSPQSGDGGGEYQVADDHDWENGDLDESVVDDILRKGLDKTERDGQAGNVSAKILQEINQALTPPQVPWTRRLNRVIGRSLTYLQTRTRNRAHRVYGLMTEGREFSTAPKVFILIDQSGSMSNEMVGVAISEANGILKHYQESTMVSYFDTAVSEPIKISSFKTMPQREFAGGTNFDVAIEFAKKMKPELIIVLTDGDCELSPDTRCRIPITWLLIDTPERERHNRLMGSKIYINSEDALRDHRKKGK